jgi:chaperonin GroES
MIQRILSLLLVVSSTSSAWIAQTTTNSRRRTHPPVASSSPSLSAAPITLDGQEIRQDVTPVGNLLLVRLKDTLTATVGGILLPDQSKQRPTEGLVLAAGPGKLHPHTGVRIDNPVKEGMSVL